MTLKTPQEHCPCTCLDDYTRRGLEDPHCFSCQAGAELVLDVRAELREALAVEFEEQAREGSSRLFRAADVARTFGGDALARPPAERRTLAEQQGSFVAVKIPMFVREPQPALQILGPNGPISVYEEPPPGELQMSIEEALVAGANMIRDQTIFCKHEWMGELCRICSKCGAWL